MPAPPRSIQSPDLLGPPGATEAESMLPTLMIAQRCGLSLVLESFISLMHYHTTLTWSWQFCPLGIFALMCFKKFVVFGVK